MRGIIILAVAVALAGCAAQPFGQYGDPAPGFWWGLLHGAIAPFSLIGSFFDPAIRAYAALNTGWWYDLGFVLGLMWMVAEQQLTACNSKPPLWTTFVGYVCVARRPL